MRPSTTPTLFPGSQLLGDSARSSMDRDMAPAGQAPSRGATPPTEALAEDMKKYDMMYEVEWLFNGQESGMFTTLVRHNIARRKNPLTRALLKTWLQEVADCEMIQVS